MHLAATVLPGVFQTYDSPDARRWSEQWRQECVALSLAVAMEMVTQAGTL